MADFKAEEVEAAKKILTTFASYSFQKTSMQDIAKAAGVSRQSVYKRFGSKEKCYEQVIKVYLADMYYRIFDKLEQSDTTPRDTLLNVFTIFVGESIEVVSQAHGTEVFDDCLKLTRSCNEDWPLRLRARLADYLTRHGLATSEKAEGVAFTLIYAGKGMMLEERNREQFIQDMKLIINSSTTQV